MLFFYFTVMVFEVSYCLLSPTNTDTIEWKIYRDTKVDFDSVDLWIQGESAYPPPLYEYNITHYNSQVAVKKFSHLCTSHTFCFEHKLRHKFSRTQTFANSAICSK